MSCIALARTAAAAYSPVVLLVLLRCSAVARVSLLALVAASALGCSAEDDAQSVAEGGQTGSASCSVSPKCICDAAAPIELLRGVVHFQGENTASVEVLEVYDLGSEVAAGDTVITPYQVGFPCGLGALPAVQEGSEVLVGYAASEDGQPASNSFIVEWQATLMLTPEFSLPSGDVEVLESASACAEQFPDREPVCAQNF